MLREKVLQTILQTKLPCFVYDAVAMRQRMEMASSLLDRYFFPIKACPEPEIVRVAVAAECGLDLCSAGDADLARNANCSGSSWKFTSAVGDETLLRRLVISGASVDADSPGQALRWNECGGQNCGLRMMVCRPGAMYGSKFGIPPWDIPMVIRQLAAAGVGVQGLHFHDQHANLRPEEFAARIVQNLSDLEEEVLRGCKYVNIGGSWPMRHGNAASVEELRSAFSLIRDGLGQVGFSGRLYGEPGRWVVGPCGYWAARVAALKTQPKENTCLVVLDTNTPVPCRPSLAPFAVIRNGELVKGERTITCDLFGSANTALDLIGTAVRLPALEEGDIIVSSGHGAYTRSLIPPFNERERPGAVVAGD